MKFILKVCGGTGQTSFPWGNITSSADDQNSTGTIWITIGPNGTSEVVPGPTPDDVSDWDLAVPVEKKLNKDGCRCRKCKNHFEFAEANQEDGTFLCFTCRRGY